MAHVTIPDTSPRVQYIVGSTPTSDFAIPFSYFNESEIQVYVDETLKTQTTEYTIASTAVDNGYEGGTITFRSPITGSTITVYRSVAFERLTDFPTNGPFDITQLNSELDAITAQMQQVNEQFDRTLKVSVTSTASVEGLADDLAVVADYTAQIDTVATDLTGGSFNADTAYDMGNITEEASGLTGAPDGYIVSVFNALDDVTTVATDIADVSTVAADITDVTTVATDLSGDDTIGICADNIADINTCADNITDIQLAQKWAVEEEDVVVADGKYSAYHWAQKASEGSLQDASETDYDNATSGLTATDVQAAIDEIVAAAVNAIDVIYSNTTSGLTATDVQSAIDELSASAPDLGGANTFTGTQTFNGDVSINGTMDAGGLS